MWKGSTIADGSLGLAAREEQKRWLFDGLQKSTADWRVVIGHHPVYSAGNHGVTEVLLSPSHTFCMRIFPVSDELDPKLRELGVPVYFAGHDHSHQVAFLAILCHFQVVSGDL